MNYSSETAHTRPTFPQISVKLFLLFFALQIFCVCVYADPEISFSDDQNTIEVNDAPEQKIIAFGKSVTVHKRANSVFSMGGDITVEGRVEGDVATIGGNVIQKEGSYIGGDIIVFGGAYKPEGPNPLREQGKETVTVGMFEDELRNIGQNPSQIFSPAFSLSFLAQRILVALFWFVVTLIMTTIAPGAVSRAVARIQLSWLKICALGAVAFVFITSVIVVGSTALPDYLGVTLGLMGMLLLVLGYVFGRVSLQVSVGKMIQKHFLSKNNRSETLATLFGVLAWTLLLSLPYVWLLALFTVFTFGIGLILTGRSTPKWQNP